MVIANEIRKGNAVRREGDLYLVLDLQRVRPGKGGAFVQSTLRNLRTGKSSQVRFSSVETVEVVPLLRKKLEYSYRDGSGYVFIDPETYDQITLPSELLDESKGYVVEGGGYDVVFADTGSPIQVELPASVNLRVMEAPDWLKGDSATNVRKPVKLETGLQLNVPLFIKEGETIKVDTRTGEYIGRA